LAIFVLAADAVLGSAFAMLLALLADLTIPRPAITVPRILATRADE
jgi:hypothetical protein